MTFMVAFNLYYSSNKKPLEKLPKRGHVMISVVLRHVNHGCPLFCSIFPCFVCAQT